MTISTVRIGRTRQLAVNPTTGDVLVTGFARDEQSQHQFRTVSWPADAWGDPLGT